MYPGISQRQLLRPRPRGYEMGNLVVIFLSIVSIIGTTNGFKILTNLSIVGCLLATCILCMTKMYFLRYQPLIEQAIDSGWDRIVGYAITTFLSVSLASFGLYCYSLEWAAASTPEVCSLGNFLSDTLKQDATALRCWIAPSILEILILILALFNRSRYQQYYID